MNLWKNKLYEKCESKVNTRFKPTFGQFWWIIDRASFFFKSFQNVHVVINRVSENNPMDLLIRKESFYYHYYC